MNVNLTTHILNAPLKTLILSVVIIWNTVFSAKMRMVNKIMLTLGMVNNGSHHFSFRKTFCKPAFFTVGVAIWQHKQWHLVSSKLVGPKTYLSSNHWYQPVFIHFFCLASMLMRGRINRQVSHSFFILNPKFNLSIKNQINHKVTKPTLFTTLVKKDIK